MPKIMLGCVADDFTGASDWASFLQKAGAKCLLINGLPDAGAVPEKDYDAIVIALKTRSIAAQAAVAQSLAAFRWLAGLGPQVLYFKYCSTFDSTPAGNIGPVLDALTETFRLPYTLICPSLPVNRRTVRGGILYADGVPLAESSMRNHPVNPMWDSFIPALMQPQSKYPCHVVPAELLEDEAALAAAIEQWKAQSEHFYLVPDYTDDGQGAVIAQRFRALRLVSGGSALAPHFYRTLRGHAAGSAQDAPPRPPSDTRVLILSGSCSQMTGRQIRRYVGRGNPSVTMSAQKLLCGEQTVAQLWDAVCASSGNVIVHSYAGERCHSEAEQEKISAVLEHTVAELGRRAITQGIRNLVVAGGETSGAVIQSLSANAFEIGASVAPGVPLLYPVDLPGVQIALKSGNFGGPDFFQECTDLMRKGGSYGGRASAKTE